MCENWQLSPSVWLTSSGHFEGVRGSVICREIHFPASTPGLKKKSHCKSFSTEQRCLLFGYSKERKLGVPARSNNTAIMKYYKNKTIFKCCVFLVYHRWPGRGGGVKYRKNHIIDGSEIQTDHIIDEGEIQTKSHHWRRRNTDHIIAESEIQIATEQSVPLWAAKQVVWIKTRSDR